MHKTAYAVIRMWTVNETTESDMIMSMHRLKRLIGSFYHQKRIDIIITDNAPYVRNGGMWKQKNVVLHPYAVITFTRSDRQLQVNNGMTLTHNDFNGAAIVNDSTGANVTNLPVGDYSVYLTLPLSTSAGWLNLNIGGSSGITNLGPTVSEQLTGGSGYTRLKFGHDAESNSDEHEDTGFHKQ